MTIARPVATAVGWSVLAGYLMWNAAWLSRGTLPPSILSWFTRVPSPTTGGTRAMLAMWQGQIGVSFAWHPLALPIVALFVATLGRLAWLLIRRRPVLLSRRWAWAWGALLAVAWGVQLANPSVW